MNHFNSNEYLQPTPDASYNGPPALWAIRGWEHQRQQTSRPSTHSSHSRRASPTAHHSPHRLGMSHAPNPRSDIWATHAIPDGGAGASSYAPPPSPPIFAPPATPQTIIFQPRLKEVLNLFNHTSAPGVRITAILNPDTKAASRCMLDPLGSVAGSAGGVDWEVRVRLKLGNEERRFFACIPVYAQTSRFAVARCIAGACFDPVNIPHTTGIDSARTGVFLQAMQQEEGNEWDAYLVYIPSV
ncbi:hypothetical protein MKEN_01463500 [Mycena kentingensis (nom. inval.)]|nr:hypothetical protein MKEN_01463500 [Mycena kentingensis (nom. inval.)]